MMRSEDDKQHRAAVWASIALPPDLAAEFSESQRDVLAAIAREIMSSGVEICQKSASDLARASGRSSSAVRAAVKRAEERGLLHRKVRYRPDRGSDANTITVTSPSWLTWLGLR